MAQTDWFAQYKLTPTQQRHVATVQVHSLHYNNIVEFSERITILWLQWNSVCLCADVFETGEIFRNRQGLQSSFNAASVLVEIGITHLDSLHKQNDKISSENFQRRTSETVKSSMLTSATPSTGKRMRQQIHEFKLLYAEVWTQISSKY